MAKAKNAPAKSAPKSATPFAGLTVAHGSDIPEGLTFTVDISEVIWVQALNPREISFGNPLADYNSKWEVQEGSTDPNDGKWTGTAQQLKDGISRLMRKGWDPGADNAEVFAIGDDLRWREVANNEIDAKIALLETLCPPAALAMKVVYANRDKVRFIGTSANRRGIGIIGAMAWLHENTGAPIGAYPVVCHLVPKHVKSEQDLILSSLQENMSVGEKLMTSQDFLALGRKLRRISPETFSQQLLIKHNYKKGEAQKVDNLLTLDANWPQLKLVDRLLMPMPPKEQTYVYTEDGPLPLASFPHTTVTKVNKGELPDGKGEKIPGGVTLDWLKTWVRTTAEGGRQTGVSITDIGKQFGAHQCKLLQDLATAVSQNNLTAFATLVKDQAEAINAVYKS